MKRQQRIDIAKALLTAAKAIDGVGLSASVSRPRASEQDMLDAIQHADLYGDQGWTLDDFNILPMGEVPLSRVRGYEDWGGWIDVDPEDFAGMSTEERLAELSSFRGPKWAARAAEWLTKGIPPIVVIDAPIVDEAHLHRQIGDGRGRVNFALAMGLKTIPVVIMKWKHPLATSGSTASASAPTWFHGGSADDVQQVKALGHFPADYAPRRGNWGAGVYLTSSNKEAKQFGDVVIGVSVPASVKLLDMRDPAYRAMPSTVFDKLHSEKAKAAFQEGWNAGDIGGAVRAGVLADGYGGVIWKGDAWSDWAVIFDPTQVRLTRRG
jgi:hypothetical protein